ncbi:uncharacterized protein B0H18DRAFT_1118819 [Fomitopsis serialis]|uniref:uncharacterized protein n=1 Tax=Fomitopsis serialis TaxID=139415 RepID=UPI0020073B6D|nr:uncharacterized protein B0H18DRAFT_1118819 [Neoantrodia serialis]KAH9926750.1 hypothetical protein B0H18DRAFT_1118819 [Neoantrodia serialis]
MSASQSSQKLPAQAAPEAKARGANRSTKVAGKLKVLPDQPEPVLPAKKESEEEADSDEDGDDEEEPEDVETGCPALTKRKAKSLPRVTAYATAGSYRFPELMKFFNARRPSYHTNPRIIDEVIYTPYAYDEHAEVPSGSQRQVHFQPDSPETGDLLGVPELVPDRDGHAHTDGEQEGAEIFMFKYGTVVLWGMTEAQEKRFLSSIKRFEVDKLAPHAVEMEDLNYYYANYSRIYNDVITLRVGTKLSLSHALSQSVKISLFEELISSTIEETKDIPEIISETGKIGMPHKDIMRKIGELFLLRANINSVGSVLDSPEVFWTYPDLQPLYDAARDYLEIPQRIDLLNTRVEVLQDMLQLLKETVSSRHAERLEQIVIALIGVEIVLGIITIIVDLFA